MRNLKIYNFNYEFTGEPSLAPIKVFDNDEFTYFQFSGKSSEVPAIFTVDSAGFESLVNFRSAGNYIIVERIAAQFTLRNGNDIVCVYNNNLLKTGRVVAPGQKRPKSNIKDPKMSPLGYDNAAPFSANIDAPMPKVNNNAPQPLVYPNSQNLQNLNAPAGLSFQSGSKTAVATPSQGNLSDPQIPVMPNFPSQMPKNSASVGDTIYQKPTNQNEQPFSSLPLLS